MKLPTSSRPADVSTFFIFVQVSLPNVVWETDIGAGVLCSAERLVRKAARLGNVGYGASPRDASPEPRAGLFCRTKESPSTPSVLSLPLRGTTRFSEGSDLEVLNSRGKVLWSAREGLDLHRADEKIHGKHSPDVAKANPASTRRRGNACRLKQARVPKTKATGGRA